MGRILVACKRLQELCGGLVLLVYHTGKDGAKGMRGHSSLFAALDAAIEVSRSEARRNWKVAKSKDGVDGGQESFVLEQVDLGFDGDNDPVTSCVIQRGDPGSSYREPKLSSTEKWHYPA